MKNPYILPYVFTNITRRTMQSYHLAMIWQNTVFVNIDIDRLCTHLYLYFIHNGNRIFFQVWPNMPCSGFSAIQPNALNNAFLDIKKKLSTKPWSLQKQHVTKPKKKVCNKYKKIIFYLYFRYTLSSVKKKKNRWYKSWIYFLCVLMEKKQIYF